MHEHAETSRMNLAQRIVVPSFVRGEHRLWGATTASIVFHILFFAGLYFLARPWPLPGVAHGRVQLLTVQLNDKTATPDTRITNTARIDSMFQQLPVTDTAKGNGAQSVPTATAATNLPAKVADEPKNTLLSLPPAPDYIFSSRLQVAPQPLVDVEPVFPDRAGKQNGTVVLRLLINEKGDVDNVAVVRAFPEGFFEESALAAFGQAKFSPGKVLGVPVKSQMTIEVDFAWVRKDA
jgi:TonB family protein